MRSYLLIACTDPYMVFFRHGYARLTCDPYDPASNNLTAHLTNQVTSSTSVWFVRYLWLTEWNQWKLFIGNLT